MFRIGLTVGREDQDIVKVGNAKNVKIAPKSDMHVVLKSRRGISEAEGHHYIFEVAVASTEGCFPFITFLNADPVVGVLDVDLAEEFSVG